jgi:hypothetical protein
VGHPKQVRKAETRKQMHDWRDAEEMRPIEAELVEEVAREFQMDEVEAVAPAASLNPTQMISPQRHLSEPRTLGSTLTLTVKCFSMYKSPPVEVSGAALG